MRKNLLLLVALVLVSFQSEAQFRNLLKKVEHKALENVLGDTPSPQTQSENSQPEQKPENQNQDKETSANQSQENQIKPPPPIDFPVTGETVQATHCVYQWVIDTAKIVNAISNTPQGKYAFDLARQKGLKGNDMDIFQQLLDPKNQDLMKEINTQVEAKFPQARTAEGYSRKKWDNNEWSGEGTIPANNPDPGNNPAWGGVSMPSLYFSIWGGDCSIWITDRYIKTVMESDHPTIFALYGLQAAGILDLEKNISYAIGSVFGIKFTTVQKLDTTNKENSWMNILHTIGLAKNVWPVPGITFEPGKGGKYGPYNTFSEKMIIPVRPFTDQQTGRPSDALLQLHDILSGRNDADPSHKPHYNSSYKIIYEYYFTPDLNKEFPAGIEEKLQQGVTGFKGFCVGARIEDEKGNSADYRLTNIQVDQKIDKGQFQIPADYPVMTQAQLNEAVKKQFSLKNLFKRAMQSEESGKNN